MKIFLRFADKPSFNGVGSTFADQGNYYLLKNKKLVGLTPQKSEPGNSMSMWNIW
jgi:hypothetical protein